ncbi:MAG: HTH-type transcriptional activator RhaS [Lentisphaerae bacterium ADurb.Bin242]|nr:MAG: HTH-type transcriptional activator RhaS [Lentisphaerae bacterium ADurb.Bin242]
MMKKIREPSASIPLLKFNSYARFSPQKISALKVVHHTDECVREHTHSFYELVAVEAGSATHVIDGVKYLLYTGSVCLIQPGQKHYYEDITHLSLLTFLFDIESIQGFMEDFTLMEGFNHLFGNRHNPRKMLFVDDLTLTKLDQLVVKIADEQAFARPGFRTALYILLVESILLFSRQTYELTPEKAAGAGKFAPVISFMEENFQHDIKLADLAEVAGMSVTNFRRLFKNRLGESPIQYLLILRLAKARELLMTTSLSVTDIAMKAGFNDANYFSRQFTASTGLPPRVWRAGDHGPVHLPSGCGKNVTAQELPSGTPSSSPA